MGFDPDPELAVRLERLLHPQLKRISPGLERMHALLQALDNPHHQLPPVIHLAGTNGKGSTLSFLRSILEAAGKRVHAYSSPHLISFTERIYLAGAPITKARLMPILDQLLAMQEEYPATFFEATTVAAILAFAQVEADVILLETGMGGRLDSTNIFDAPLATLITPIGYDHQDFLGETLAEIAGEKAGILRADSPAFIAKQEEEAQEVILQHPAKSFHLAGRDWECEKLSAQQWQFTQGETSWKLPLPGLQGDYQIENAAMAVACIRHCFPQVSQCDIAAGVKHAFWPARLQPLDSGYWRQFVPAPLPLMLDGAHNVHAGQQLVKYTRQWSEPPVLVIAMKADKDAEAFLKLWQGKVTAMIFTTIPDETESISPQKLQEIAMRYNIESHQAKSVEAALQRAAEYEKPVLICGSLYLAGAVLAKN